MSTDSLIDTMTIDEKRAWLTKQNGNWNTSVSKVAAGETRVLLFWYTPHTGKQFQAMGRNHDVALDRLFDRVYKSLLAPCILP